MVWTISLVLAWTVIFHTALQFSMCSAELSFGSGRWFPSSGGFWCGFRVRPSPREKKLLTRTFFLTLFSAARRVACLKEGGASPASPAESCGSDWHYLFSIALFLSVPVPSSGGAGLEKQAGPRWCGEVGTFQNIVACHRKDDWWHRLDYDQIGQWPVCLTCVSTRRRR